MDTTTVVHLTLDHDDEARGHEFDNQQSLRGDSASNLTPPEEDGRRLDRDDRDLCDIIHSKPTSGA
jgi:hypothetical protein